MLAIGLVWVPGLATGAEDAVCVGRSVGPADAVGFIEEALRVLRACGYDPANYRADLLGNDPFSGPQEATSPERLVVFRPLDETRLHVLTVSPADPCVVGWVSGASGLTAWQRTALERARDHVRATRPAWSHPERWNLKVTETRDHVGFRLTINDPQLDDGELRVLLRKLDLAVLASDESGALPE